MEALWVPITITPMQNNSRVAVAVAVAMGYVVSPGVDMAATGLTFGFLTFCLTSNSHLYI